ncbi:S-adenosylmethionine decarboxylase [Candidatus Izimaplasma bacterium ZiA1]|uniref:adenosylmethionine decarboxylase n=1 Tax=Candidatus Izimoplasma sp. ZiA1 TaxID=2024899 RepID=UPI000BAA62E4|nr:S-adenosylmethionine decarboxylase [Candidatus Izimaplasma bacterium ZiA1]
MKNKLALYGFNNLTKSLSFNIYDVCITETEEDRKKYIEYIDEIYNSQRLMNILQNVADRIGASILNVSKQDYEPQGASVTVLISEEEVPLYAIDPSCNNGILTPLNETIVTHLDKSHLTVHTYPESHPQNGVSTFRVDIDVSTCGEISPLNALDYLIDSFDSDIISLDYKVRGFTRNNDGKKLFKDHAVSSIQNFISEETIKRYNLIDVNVYQENIFHTKMMLNNLNLDDYLLDKDVSEYPVEEQKRMIDLLETEMKEIFYGKNFD